MRVGFPSTVGRVSDPDTRPDRRTQSLPPREVELRRARLAQIAIYTAEVLGVPPGSIPVDVDANTVCVPSALMVLLLDLLSADSSEAAAAVRERARNLGLTHAGPTHAQVDASRKADGLPPLYEDERRPAAQSEQPNLE